MNRFHTDVKSFMENAILTVYVRVITALFTWYISKNQINIFLSCALLIVKKCISLKRTIIATHLSRGMR